MGASVLSFTEQIEAAVPVSASCPAGSTRTPSNNNLGRSSDASCPARSNSTWATSNSDMAQLPSRQRFTIG